MCIRDLKQALNHVLILEKVHLVYKFDQKTRLRPYIGMNTGLRKKASENVILKKIFYCSPLMGSFWKIY